MQQRASTCANSFHFVFLRSDALIIFRILEEGMLGGEKAAEKA
jgi:hypothetical protein